MSRRVCEHLAALNEGHGFLRGLVAFVGFPQAFVEYDRDARHSGATNYNRFTGSLKIGFNGIISFGSRPLQLMSITGFLFAGLSFLIGMYYVIAKLAGASFNPGLPTTVLVVTFFAGVQLLSLGLMGEYVGRIYDEVKRRPKYIVDKQVNMSPRTAIATATATATVVERVAALAPPVAAEPEPESHVSKQPELH